MHLIGQLYKFRENITVRDTAKRREEWRTTDLCTQCQALGLGASWSEDRHVRHRVRISREASCPLCLYFLSIVERTPTEAGEYVTVVVDSTPDAWDNSQRRLMFMDESQLHVLARYILYPADQRHQAHTTTTYRVIDRGTIDPELLKTWINSCRTSHAESCSYRNIMGAQGIPDNKGFKVIDCATRKIVKADMKSVSFIALSYVWGQASAGDADCEPNCLPTDLPDTIADAIQLAMQLEFKYLWVDRYCIDQSDPEDVRAQVLIMDIIYQAASLTIIAAAGSDSTFGLPGISLSRDTPETICVDGCTWVAVKSDYKHAIKQSTWFTRGWT